MNWIKTDDAGLITGTLTPASLAIAEAVVKLESGASDSPALEALRDGERGAFELKFLVSSQQAAQILLWARNNLQPDSHGDSALGGGYLVNTVYCDTPQFNTYHREGSYHRRKLRVRRYGAEPVVWLECKRKRAGQVQKRRVAIPAAELQRLLTADDLSETDPAAWFCRRLRRRGLQPVCRATYLRYAFVGSSATGTVRLTLDRDLRAEPTEGWQVPSAPLTARQILPDQQILELKFRGAIPVRFRELVEQFKLEVTACSKFRSSAAAAISAERLYGAREPQ